MPSGAGESMYLRPLMIATEAALGVRPAKEYLFLLFGSPSGDYFPQGVKPISLWLCTDYVRAAPGGTGEAKCAGNYAASLVAQQKAIDEGCVQVIWLDAVERKWVEEMGGMNLFFVYKDGRGAQARHAEAHRHAAGGRHARQHAQAGARPGLRRRRAHGQRARLGAGLERWRARRGVRLRYRGRHHAGRRSEVRRRQMVASTAASSVRRAPAARELARDSIRHPARPARLDAPRAVMGRCALLCLSSRLVCAALGARAGESPPVAMFRSAMRAVLEPPRFGWLSSDRETGDLPSAIALGAKASGRVLLYLEFPELAPGDGCCGRSCCSARRGRR